MVPVSLGLWKKSGSVMNWFSANLQITAGFGLPVVYSILFHAHEGGVIICLAVGIALA